MAATAIVMLLPYAASLPGWWGQLVQLAVVSAPALAAVALAIGCCASGGFVRRVFAWRWSDLGLGVAVALLLRGVQEVLAPTTGSLLVGFEAPSPLTLGVVIAGAVVVTPVVEELFFRGLLLAALVDAFGGVRRLLSAGGAVAVSAAVFAWLHIVPLGTLGSPGGALWPAMLAPLLLGIACGVVFVLTRRLAAGIVTHVVFNASGMLLLLL
ncbi:type II CAAX prenyl endopeptidase Rce1 family protein [Microbacterium sp. NPDC055910]|uniref:CPBP family glutamic-type intramembrane protease n=1 Tax=Microbacterium sp. NPDC055910 TaxID=3345659 RepID=UPI0035DE4497